MTIRFALTLAVAAGLAIVVSLGTSGLLLAQEDGAASKTSESTNKDDKAAAEEADKGDDQPASDPAKPAADASAADAAKPADDSKPDGAAKPADEGTPAEQYAQVRAKWDALQDRIQQTRTQFFTVPATARASILEEYRQYADEAKLLLGELREKGVAAYVAKPNEDDKLSDLLIGIMADDIRNGHKAEAEAMLKVLQGNNYPNHARLGVALFLLGWFDQATPELEMAAKSDAPKTEQAKLCIEEMQIRQAEAKADDLPRVLLKTSKGDVLVELFENEAPETVGNFISLVEKDFYNGLDFHRVLDGFMAQGGDPNGNGTGGPGYKIYCETDKENHRNHFRGSLSMAHSGKDTGGSQFFITFTPTPHLDGLHTVFGRVVEGMENIDALTRTDAGLGVKPDKILEAEVLRKREHEYAPHKVEKTDIPAPPTSDSGSDAKKDADAEKSK
ncbi:MAG: peptidylprolyl isomerase [Pirellulaceae bacterium]